MHFGNCRKGLGYFHGVKEDGLSVATYLCDRRSQRIYRTNRLLSSASLIFYFLPLLSDSFSCSFPDRGQTVGSESDLRCFLVHEESI